MANTQNKNVLIANRYADALVEIVKSGKLTYEKVSTDLNLIQSTLIQSPDLNEFLINPIISIEDKKSIIDKVFSEEIDGLVVNFLKVLIDKSRFSSFNEVLESYNEILDKINKLSRIKVISAVSLSDDAKWRLKEKLESKLQKTVVFDWEINSEIIAGLVIKMGDNIIDMSLKHKIEDLSKNIMK